MENSQINLPLQWTTVPLGSLVKERKHKNKNNVCSNLLSLSYGKIIRKNIDSTDGLLPASFETYNIIEPNDIVLRLTDLQNDQHSLRTGFCEERGIITSAYVTIYVATDKILPKFLYYFLHSFDIRKGFYGLGSGVRQGLSFDTVKKLTISFPNKDKQKQIIDFLDAQCAKVDSLLSLKIR